MRLGAAMLIRATVQEQRWRNRSIEQRQGCHLIIRVRDGHDLWIRRGSSATLINWMPYNEVRL
jgi:hypothetical protein